MDVNLEVDSTGFISIGANSLENQKFPGVAFSRENTRGHAKVLARNSGDYELSPSPAEQEIESFLLNAINRYGHHLFFFGLLTDADIQTTQYRYDGRIKPAAEPKLIQTGGTTPIRPDEDICSLFEAYQLNHDDLRHETTWRLFTAQPQNTTKKNHPKIYYHEELMGVTIQQFSDASDKDLRSHDESFRPDQEANGNKSNCSRTPTNHKHAAKWKQPIISSHEGDIVFLKQRILHLLYLEAHGFWRLQTYHWRPGDFMILLKYSYNILGCTNMHRIKWIKLEPNFPFSDPFDINAERLFPLTLVRLPELYSVHLDIPRHHQYSPKLSRLKHQRLFPYSADTPQSRPTAICIKFDSFVSFFRFLGRCTQLYIS